MSAKKADAKKAYKAFGEPWSTRRLTDRETRRRRGKEERESGRRRRRNESGRESGSAGLKRFCLLLLLQLLSLFLFLSSSLVLSLPPRFSGLLLPSDWLEISCNRFAWSGIEGFDENPRQPPSASQQNKKKERHALLLLSFSPPFFCWLRGVEFEDRQKQVFRPRACCPFG